MILSVYKSACCYMRRGGVVMVTDMWIIDGTSVFHHCINMVSLILINVEVPVISNIG